MQLLEFMMESHLEHFALSTVLNQENMIIDYPISIPNLLNDREKVLQYYQKHNKYNFKTEFEKIIKQLDEINSNSVELTEKFTYALLFGSSNSQVLQIICENYTTINSYYEKVDAKQLGLSKVGKQCFLMLLNAKYCAESEIFEESVFTEFVDQLTLNDLLLLSMLMLATTGMFTFVDIIDIELHLESEDKWLTSMYYDDVVENLRENSIIVQDELLSITISNILFRNSAYLTDKQIQIIEESVKACAKHDLYLIDVADMLQNIRKRGDKHEKINGCNCC